MTSTKENLSSPAMEPELVRDARVLYCKCSRHLPKNRRGGTRPEMRTTSPTTACLRVRVCVFANVSAGCFSANTNTRKNANLLLSAQACMHTSELMHTHMRQIHTLIATWVALRIYWLRVSSIGALPLSLQVDFHCVSFDGLHMKMNTVKVWLVALVHGVIHVNEFFLTAQYLP